MTRPVLTVVVIGENEADHLQQTLASVDRIPASHEIIYVDSASTDGSVGIARRAGVRVAKLERSDLLCAAAGRYVGTLLARGEWILYLDGDMELAAEFAKRIPDLVNRPVRRSVVGYVGWYENRYPDGTARWNVLRQNAARFSAVAFGGALLIQRGPVVQVGNWDYRVASYEELDLHTRLKCGGFRIAFVAVRMVTHHTPRPNSCRLLLRMFMPFGEGSRRTGGIGQLLRSRFSHRSLLSFLWHFPRPFVFIALLLLGVGVGFSSLPRVYSVLLFISLGIGCAVVAKRLPSAVVYLSFPLRIIVGWSQYRSGWVPKYRLMDTCSGGEAYAQKPSWMEAWTESSRSCGAKLPRRPGRGRVIHLEEQESPGHWRRGLYW